MEFVLDIGALRARLTSAFGPSVAFPAFDGRFSRGDTVVFDRETRKEGGRTFTTEGKSGVIVEILDRDDGNRTHVREFMIVVPAVIEPDGREVIPQKLYRRNKRDVERHGGPGHAAA